MANLGWPASGIPAGQVCDQFLSSLELLPSLTIAAGASAPQALTLDGYDWWSTLRGETKTPRNEMFWKRRELTVARVGNWKWFEMGGGNGGLCDLADAPGETTDLSEDHPGRLKLLHERYKAWLDEMDAAEPRGPFHDY